MHVSVDLIFCVCIFVYVFIEVGVLGLGFVFCCCCCFSYQYWLKRITVFLQPKGKSMDRTEGIKSGEGPWKDILISK